MRFTTSFYVKKQIILILKVVEAFSKSETISDLHLRAYDLDLHLSKKLTCISTRKAFKHKIQ